MWVILRSSKSDREVTSRYVKQLLRIWFRERERETRENKINNTKTEKKVTWVFLSIHCINKTLDKCFSHVEKGCERERGRGREREGEGEGGEGREREGNRGRGEGGERGVEIDWERR